MGCLYQGCNNALSELQVGKVTSRKKTFHYSVQEFYTFSGKILTIMKNIQITGKLWLGFSIQLATHSKLNQFLQSEFMNTVRFMYSSLHYLLSD